MAEQLRKSESYGAAITEYVVITALALVVVIAAIYGFQGSVKQTISDQAATHPFRLESKSLLHP